MSLQDARGNTKAHKRASQCDRPTKEQRSNATIEPMKHQIAKEKNMCIIFYLFGQLIVLSATGELSVAWPPHVSNRESNHFSNRRRSSSSDKPFRAALLTDAPPFDPPDAAEAAACEEEGAADEVEGVGADRSGILIPPLFLQ